MSNSFRLFPEPFHPENFVQFSSSTDLMEHLRTREKRESFILSVGEIEKVDFSYFIRFSDSNFCLSLCFEYNQGQYFYHLENACITKQSKGSHIHDGLGLGNLIRFKIENLEMLKRVFSSSELVGFRALACPKMSGKIKALFLDRDGVINIDKAYVFKKEDLEFSPGIFAFLKHAQTLSYELHVLTNQSGVARGFYKEEDVKKLHFFMNEELKQAGVFIKSWSYCLFHEEATVLDFKKESLLRKPDPGMLLSLSNHYAFNFDQSIMVGDKKSDILPINGLRTILLQGKYSLDNAACKIVGSLEELSLLL
jgi:D-glycero-D-manno-heptose 1,7-bisphosphate phosphatase